MNVTTERAQNALPRLRELRARLVAEVSGKSDKDFLVICARATALDVAIAALEQLAKEGAH